MDEKRYLSSMILIGRSIYSESNLISHWERIGILPMSKLTALAIGMLMVISIAPKSQATTTKIDAPSLQPAANLHSQIILKAAEHPREYSNHRRDDESEDRHHEHRGERERARRAQERARAQEQAREHEHEREREHEREAAEHHRHKVPPTAIIKIGDIITIKL
jgi:hypothetical protein